MEEIKVKCPECGYEFESEEKETYICEKCGHEFSVQKEEENKEENVLSEEEIAAMTEEGLEFSETISSNDVYNFNRYLLEKSSANLLSRILFSIMGLIVVCAPIAQYFNAKQEDGDPKFVWWMVLIGALMLVYGIILYNPIQRMLIARNLKKRNVQDLKINIKLGKQYIKYALATEEKAPLIKVKDIYRVAITPEYIYLHINAYSIVILKLIDNDQKEQIIDAVKETFTNCKKFKIYKK